MLELRTSENYSTRCYSSAGTEKPIKKQKKHLVEIEVGKFPPKLNAALHKLAKQRHMTRDQLIIDILTRELDRQ